MIVKSDRIENLQSSWIWFGSDRIGFESIRSDRMWSDWITLCLTRTRCACCLKFWNFENLFFHNYVKCAKKIVWNLQKVECCLVIYYDGLNDLHESTVNNKNCELCSLRKFKCLVSGSSIHMTVYMFCAGALKDPFLFLTNGEPFYWSLSFPFTPPTPTLILSFFLYWIIYERNEPKTNREIR